MTPRQAAETIGCTPGQVRWLIRSKYLRATKITTNPLISGCDYRYSVGQKEAERYRDVVQTRGFPRGQKRSKK